MDVTCACVIGMKQNNERDETYTSGQMLMVLLNGEVRGRETQHVALIFVR